MAQRGLAVVYEEAIQLQVAPAQAVKGALRLPAASAPTVTMGHAVAATEPREMAPSGMEAMEGTLVVAEEVAGK